MTFKLKMNNKYRIVKEIMDFLDLFYDNMENRIYIFLTKNGYWIQYNFYKK